MMNYKVFGQSGIDANTIAQMDKCSAVADKSALMADAHFGYGVPIGGVVAFRNAISPTAVGYDIACGNKAVRLDAHAGQVKRDIGRIMDEIAKQISFGIGRHNEERVEHELFDDPLFSESELLSGLRQRAQSQLGTVGGGNHYVDVFVSEKSEVWAGVHFGSRGFGHAITRAWLTRHGAKDSIDADMLLLGLDTDSGEEYYRAMTLAGRYAYAGRNWVCQKVANIIGAIVLEEVHNHHNFAWRETHGGEEYVVIRKGATPAFLGQRGFVGGSMGDVSFVIEGVESPESADALYSTVHGAGRIMSRTDAKGKRARDGTVTKAARITRTAMDEWTSGAGVCVRGGDVDEAPQAYKRIETVLAAQGGTVRVLEVLHPIGVSMADARTIDPYKD